MSHISLTLLKKITRDSYPVCRSYWDDDIKGFGVRCQGKSISYILMYRNSYGTRRLLTIGKVGKMTPEQARELAKNYLVEVVKGGDPATNKQKMKHLLTVADLCDWYLREGTNLKKPRTIQDDIGRINNHIKPIIGKLPVESVKRSHIEKLLLDVETGRTVKKQTEKKHQGNFATGGVGVANRVHGLLGAIFEFARIRDLTQINPCRGIKRPQDKTRDAFLTLDEMRQFGQVLDAPRLRALYQPTLDMIKLILLTGCRRDEIATLRWEYIDLQMQCFHFPDTKTGKQTRPFGLGAKHLLESLYKERVNGYVFPSVTGKGYNRSANRVLEKVKAFKNEQGAFIIRQDITLHALRHSFASLAADMGYSDFTIAGLLGHRLGTMTSRYTHAIDRSLILAADAVSLKIEQALNGKGQETAEIIDIAKSA